MTSLEKLLEATSPEKVCGEDLDARSTAAKGDADELSRFEKLLDRIKLAAPAQKDAKGEEIPAFGRSRPASDSRDWKGILEEAFGLLEKSKDLRLVLIVCLGLLKTKQLPGLKDGLSFLHRLLEKYWEHLYPSSPRRRLNTLNSLSLPAQRVDSPYDFVQTLRAIPLAHPPKDPPITLNDIRATEKACVKEPDKAAAHRKRIEDAFSRSDPSALKAAYTLLNSILEKVEEIVGFLNEKDASPDFSSLDDTLREMASHLEPYANLAPNDELVEDNSTSPERKTEPQPALARAQEKKGASAKAGLGQIESVDDVAKVLREIYRYYDAHDRSSPVPLLLKRAERLAKMNFSEIMEEMTSEEIAKLKATSTSEQTQPTT